jgi:hypothetical protein
MAIAALERPVERRLRTLAPLVVDDGCDVRVRGGVQDAVRVALLEWLPLTAGELHVLAAELENERPADALAAIVRPPTIWKTCEALAVDSRARVDDAHLGRLRAAAARLEQQLHVAGLEAAVASDDACATVARTVRTRFATSAFVAARRKEAAPTMNGSRPRTPALSFACCSSCGRIARR